MLSVCIYALCVCGSAFMSVCAPVLGLSVYVCVPVIGLVSLILPSVADAPRSSFSRAMTRSEIVMKLLIYQSLSRLHDSPQVGWGRWMRGGGVDGGVHTEEHAINMTQGLFWILRFAFRKWWASPPPLPVNLPTTSEEVFRGEKSYSSAALNISSSFDWFLSLISVSAQFVLHFTSLLFFAGTCSSSCFSPTPLLLPYFFSTTAKCLLPATPHSRFPGMPAARAIWKI